MNQTLAENPETSPPTLDPQTLDPQTLRVAMGSVTVRSELTTGAPRQRDRSAKPCPKTHQTQARIEEEIKRQNTFTGDLKHLGLICTRRLCALLLGSVLSSA